MNSYLRYINIYRIPHYQLTYIQLRFQNLISNRDVFITLNIRTVRSIFHFCSITLNDTKSPKSVSIVCFEIGS